MTFLIVPASRARRDGGIHDAGNGPLPQGGTGVTRLDSYEGASTVLPCLLTNMNTSPGAGKKATGCIMSQRRDAKMQIPAKEVSDLFW